MSTVGWRSLGQLRNCLWTRESKPHPQTQKRHKAIPDVESLEGITLLSARGALSVGRGVAVRHEARHHLPAMHVTKPHGLQPSSPSSGSMAADPSPVTLPAQTLTLGMTLTNYTNLPLSPALNLFNPSLGTLVSVAVSHSALLQSAITSQNLSPTGGTVITGSLSGGYQINGLNQPIVYPTQMVSTQPQPAGAFPSPTDTVTFPPLQLTDHASAAFTDAASLAFFTAAPGRTTITPTMTAKASGSASAPNGNLFTTTQTSASATVTVSYTYLPPVPQTTCPTPGTIGRIGVHHQRTLLILPFTGAVNPTLAGTPSNYSVITRGGKTIPIITASYNPATNSVTLIPAHRLNVHEHFRLRVALPCPSGLSGETVILPFGGKYSLIGFHNKRGRFVSVENGHIVRLRDPLPDAGRARHRERPEAPQGRFPGGDRVSKGDRHLEDSGFQTGTGPSKTRSPSSF